MADSVPIIPCMLAMPSCIALRAFFMALSRSSDAMTAGEVDKVDKDQGKVTIRHEPLANLGMPAMTMVFRVKDADMLDEVREGDKNSVRCRSGGWCDDVDAVGAGEIRRRRQ